MPGSMPRTRVQVDAAMTETIDVPAFAWYRLHGREAAALCVLLLAFAVLAGVALAHRGVTREVEFKSRTLPAARVYVNRAGVSELAALPGIGPRKAERIIEARAKAPITDLASLARAAGGISAANLERMRPYVEFGP